MATRSPLDDWKHQAGARRPGRPGTPAKSGRRSRLLYVLVPFLIGIGVAIGLLFYLKSKPKPLVLSVCIGEYEAWPANAFAQQDGEGFKENDRYDDPKVVFQGQETADAILNEVAALAERAGRKQSQPAIIHVCALAAVDQGEVAILPAKSAPGKPGTWLKLDQFLGKVRGMDGNRLVILDLRPVADPRLGQAGDELAPAMHAQLQALEQAGKLPFVVLAQCAPAEYPFVSPELNRGVVAEFVHRGLNGHADQVGDGDGNGMVTAEELVRYVRARVAHWLARHDAPIVVPTRYGKSDDFVLLTVPQPLPAERDPATQEGSPAVAEGWKKLDAWRDAGAIHKTPRTFRELEEAVRRADRRWSGGGPGPAIESELGNAMTALDRQRGTLGLRDYPVLSLGRARRRGIPQEDDIRKAMRPHLQPIAQLPPKKEESSAKKEEAPPPKVVPIPEKPPEAPPYDGIVSATLKAIDEAIDPPTIDQLRLYVALLKTLGDLPAHQEVALLVYFADADNTIPYRKQWPPAAAQVGLRAAVSSWRAAAADGRSFNRIKKLLGDTNADFRKGLLDLFIKSDAKRAEAVILLRSLEDRYRQVTDLSRAQEKAMFEWEEAVALLPAVIDFTPESTTERQALDTAWTNVVSKATAVRETLDTPTDATAMERAAADLKTQRERLRDLLRAVPKEATLGEKRARLRLPIWTVPERNQQTAEINAAALDRAKIVLEEPASPPADEARVRTANEARFKELAERRRNRARDLLGLAGAEPPGAGNTAEMRLALTTGLTERYERESSAARERFAWLIHPADLSALPAPGGESHNDPVPDVRREAEREFAEWLVKEHLRALADELRKPRIDEPPAEAAKALAGELEKAIRELRGYP
jgi:hypothetical protein